MKHGCFSRLPCNTISYLLQHRYYGESFSFGSEDQAFQNACALGYLSSEQALADYAQLITNIKKNPSAENCPVIVVGESYGGSKSNFKVNIKTMLNSYLPFPDNFFGACLVVSSKISSCYHRCSGIVGSTDAYHVVVTRDFQVRNCLEFNFFFFGLIT